ncbi:MAG: VanZ-like protein [Paenibacillaceae bacterium]|jgi:VanZ family protein|nr:VanZ-like protein [Paenibacillaceae bacterium]
MSMLYRWFPCVAVMGAIFYFSSRTGDDLGSLLPLFQKLFPQMEGFDWGHFAAYFLLALTYVWALAGERPAPRHMVLAVMLSLLYGLTDEYHQTFVPGRTADWHDLRNDGIGASLAMLSLRLPWIGSRYARLPHRVKHS